MTDEPAEVLVITGELTELSRVRQWAKELLDDLGEDLQIDALAVVDELTSNALRHSQAPYRVSLTRAADRVRVEVADGSPEPAAPRKPDMDGGRGLLLIKAYALGWGQEIHPDGKIVWAELSLTPSGTDLPDDQPANVSAGH